MVIKSKKATKEYFCGIGLIFLYGTCIYFQTVNLTKQVFPFTDEGIYLYQSTLITHGLTPYKDFALISHVPFLLYVNAAILSGIGFNMTLFHVLYVLWVFSCIFPLFSVVRKITGSAIAGFISVFIFATFVEMVQWDMHFFAIRQASLPFFAWYLYTIIHQKNNFFSQVLLSLFSFCLISNALLSICILIPFNSIFSMQGKSLKTRWIKFLTFIRKYSLFFSLICFYYIGIALIPRSIENIFQIQQMLVPFDVRFALIISSLFLNWPMVLLGFVGIFFVPHTFGFFKKIALCTLLIPVIFSGSFYIHYLSSIGVSFAITAGITFQVFYKKWYKFRALYTLILVCGISLTTFPYLYTTLIKIKTPGFFVITNLLQKLPDPLFTVEPIFAVYAHKKIVFHYNVADMRVFRIHKTNLSDSEYEKLLSKSNTILLDPLSDILIPQNIQKQIPTRFILLYASGNYKIFVRKYASLSTVSPLYSND